MSAQKLAETRNHPGIFDDAARVNITVRGRTFDGLHIEKPTGRHSALSVFSEELRTREVSQGDRINFKTTQRTDNKAGCGL